MNNYSVSLVGPAPWGFRLQGGKDFNMPLTISRLSDGGKAANANVGIGDIVLSIDGISADGMTHLEAQNKIKTCTGKLTMNLQRTPAAPKPDPIPVQLVEPKDIVKPVPIASAVVPKVSSATNMAFNKAPRPFGAVSSPKVTSIPSPSSAFTPAHASASSRASPPPLATVTPPTFTASGLHANAKSNPGQRSPILSAAKPAVNVPWQPTHNASFNENAQEVTEGQRRGFKENQVDNKEQNGPPRKHVVYTNTEFYHPPTHSNHSKKRLIEDTEDWHPRTGTTQSRSFRILAQITGTEHMKEPEPDHSKKTKDSQTENGDWSFSTALMNGLETQYSSSVATQTCEISDVSEQPVLLSTTQREEANSASSVLLSDPAPSTAASFTKLSGTALSISSFKRELIFKNPLEALPKCAPHPPAAVHILNNNQQVAIVAKTASSYIRSNRIKTGSPVLNAPDAASLRVDGADHKRNLPVMISEATQTSELLVSPVAPVESALAAQSVKPEVVPVITDSDPLEPAQYTAATVKSMPENPENDVNRTASLSSASVPALKPAEPQYAVKTSGWQSSNQPAGSGWISNNSIGPGATVSSEKIAANVLTDEDTLVQRAEHIPAGKRTPMCAHCNQVIRGPFLVALGKSWHPEEFNCSHCKTSMAYIGFVEEKGALYCEGCYEKFFAPDCARCQRKILGEVINALKQTWHVSCFVCVACHKPIRNNVFHLEDGDPYCETDYYALFGTMCHGCEFPIEAGDRFLEALGHTWHDTCFVCSVCCDSLEGQTFFSKKDKPLCKKHAHSVNI
ncbi:PDZ and LIM domain protein 5 isoform X5 [Anolis carolinensis]|uniref:PDZ and LIM domain protein 5 isoform X5 n=1 Tax=Anolis carolinensis TaxID=28377 RepID=UPI0004627ED8|nr:PREDICTED: PDZ and LIM domain protein 5 isoform X4 [Anolis carolinensis]|eukprot:XP_008109267.1 PREDICTED: PDZ and LIM domain protein 5 isoform X4 [Anolis carolinensis]